MAPLYEFHISRKARDDYRFDESLFSLRGDTLFVNFRGAHLLANRVNQRRALLKSSAPPVQASHLFAAGLIDEIFHYVIGLYRRQQGRDLFRRLHDALKDRFRGETDRLLHAFAEGFPSSPVYGKAVTPAEYLAGSSDGVSNREIVIEELILLWLGNLNPAYAPLHELIDDAPLEKGTKYRELMDGVSDFFRAEAPFGPDAQPLMEMLRSPALHSPHSLEGQLKYIRERWGLLLGEFLKRLLRGIDFIREEERIRFDGPGESLVPDFSGAYYEAEPERFSADLDWMPKVVLMAKCTYVWLDQLSRRYGHHIGRLDQIPDQELDRLAAWGITGLWLIGLWERSRASKKIKRWCGNPDAEASAYSLHDYHIAADLGGDVAYENLRDRAWRRGIRLASDMVPNHMGLDSRWVAEHPHWFIQSGHSPFPSYTFSGGDLSEDDRMAVHIEDGYWHKTDAAVVFKRVDRHSGEVRYIYHGNDGTQMPWNDTAQLNFLLPEVREAVIQTILYVARKFPIIRFDAAMTLAKRHYQRLWFPEPGSGGDIPTRAEHAMTKEAFNRAFPEEFWREVVDRVQREAPDTLLLAEAFWMMEGYFVRTLGMHRVYNSAFMNMLKMEENAKYREYIRKVLEFNPQILKRYVNFMNNPDEDTAIAQFGKDDKYVGVFVLMCTLPGLPMIGHGQIEGFTEKYGMEYRRAYWDEKPDERLLARHEREIFPLLKKRHLFSDVENFLLFDFYTGGGYVDENVFAYSNRCGDERTLVVYHNRYAETSGWIRHSAAYHDGAGLVSRTLAEGLDLLPGAGRFVVFRDHAAGLEFIRTCDSIIEKGLFVALGAFKYHVFLDFREVVHTSAHPYGDIEKALGGAGVPSMEEALAEFVLRAVMEPFHEAVNAGSLKWLAGGIKKGKADPERAKTFREKLRHILEGIAWREQRQAAAAEDLDRAEAAYGALISLPAEGEGEWRKKTATLLQAGPPEHLEGWRIAFCWLFLRFALEELGGLTARRAALFDEWRFSRVMRTLLDGLGVEREKTETELGLVRALLVFSSVGGELSFETLRRLLSGEEVNRLLGANWYEGVLWFNKERFETLASWLVVASIIEASAGGKLPPPAKVRKLHAVAESAASLAAEVGYRYDEFFRRLAPVGSPKKTPA